MKKASQNCLYLIIVAFCLSLTTGLSQAGQELTPPPRLANPEPRPAAGQPARFNKATGIVGMEVRNHKEERLGEIRDVVFDVQSEHIAYAVLGTGGLLDRQKLLAVPLSAFTVDHDQKCLILRAAKSQVETAAGFARNNWPSVTNPTWGAQPFWEPAGKSDLNLQKDLTIPEPGKKDQLIPEPAQKERKDEKPKEQNNN